MHFRTKNTKNLLSFSACFQQKLCVKGFYVTLIVGLMSFTGIVPLGHAATLPQPIQNEDFYDAGEPDAAKVRLGQMLFFDKILSGNKNISCATCHHPFTGTSDGLSLPVGEGGQGLSVTRSVDTIVERVPRNSPALFNLGAKEFSRMFHDGRVEIDSLQSSDFLSPAGDDLPLGLDNVLAVQAMFPVTSNTEMAGQEDENPIADAATVGDLVTVWQLLTDRLRANAEYVELFQAAYPALQDPADITFVHAANAIAAFEATIWRADNTPFDRYLRGDVQVLSTAAKRGMNLFYGKAQCDSCHSGVFQTDHQFHSIALPQIGPGKGDGISGHEDFGRERVTGDSADRYQFRTPSLRNVVLTGPWGHDGAYNSLEAIVRHHLDSQTALSNYDPEQVVLTSRADLDADDFVAYNDPDIYAAIADSATLPLVRLKESELQDLMTFLQALTDPASLDMRRDFPQSVPSGLPIND